MNKKELKKYIANLIKEGVSDAYIEASAWGKVDEDTSIKDINDMIKEARKDQAI